jgi:hypothetical protein
MGGGDASHHQETIESRPSAVTGTATRRRSAPSFSEWVDGGHDGDDDDITQEAKTINETEADVELDAPCTCTGSRLHAHRKRKCPLRALAPGLYVRNETEAPILFVLSQLTPLHWLRIEPGETKHIKCGRVFFTASTEVFNPETQPTRVGVAMRLVAITAVTAFAGTIIGLGVVGG